MGKNAVVVKNLHKSFTTRSETKTGKFIKRNEKVTKNVIDGISFEIKRGEVFGIIGRNGSGKSTTLKMISKIMKPDSGTIEINGRVASILELGMGFHSDLSGRENVYIKAAMYGFSRDQIDERIDDIVKYADLGDYIDLPIRVYSSGMTGRLAFAIMVNVDADIMILDEILSTGDIAFGKKSGTHFSNMKSKGKTIIIVAHSMGTMQEMCDRVAWIDGGKIREIGLPNVVCGHYETELAESLEITIELAESGVPAYQNALGCMYRDGNKLEKDMERAIYWFNQGANGNNDAAKINLADILILSQDTDEYDRAVDLYMSAARRGNRDARTKLSRILTEDEHNIGKEVLEDFKKLLPSGNPSLYYDYAELIMKTAWDDEGRKEALQWYGKAAEHGNQNAMYQIALMYRDGNGPILDNSKYIEWMTKAAENGHVPAQLFLGNMYRDGIRVECDETEAFRWYKMAAEKNNLDAIYQVSTMYREGKGVEEDRKESERWLRMYARHDLFRQINILADSFSHYKNGVFDLEKGMKWYTMNAEHNNVDSKYQIGMMLTDSEESGKNIYEASLLFDSAAEDGHLHSAIRLSNMHALGIAGKDVRDKAIGTLEELAEKGNAWAANSIGNMYANGDAVDADGEKAVKYLKIAARSSLSPAIQRLGKIYSEGTLIEQDLGEALRWFEEGIIVDNLQSALSIINMYFAGSAGKESLDKALKGIEDMCMKGNIHAMRTLGNYYFNGIVLKKDMDKAIHWYKIASELGDIHSKHVLGTIHRDGKGVEQSLSEALRYFMSSAEQGNINSMMTIIQMYQAGQADEEPFKIVFEYLERIANTGNVVAMRNLATIYLEAKVASEETEKAKSWFEKAAELGDVHSRRKLESMN